MLPPPFLTGKVKFLKFPLDFCRYMTIIESVKAMSRERRTMEKIKQEKKDIMFRIRVSQKDLDNLDEKVKKTGKNRSQLVREFMNS